MTRLWRINPLLTTAPFLLLVIFLLITPGLNILSFDEQRLTEVTIIVLTLIGTAFHSNIPGSILFKLPGRTLRLLLFIGVLMWLSAALAKQHTQAFLLIASYVGLFFCCLTVSSVVSQSFKPWHNGIFIIMSLAASLYLVNFFTGFLASFIEQIPLSWPEPFSGFSNVRFFNQYQIWSLLLLPLPLLLYSSLPKRLTWVIKIIATGWFVLLFASAGRGAVLGLFSAMVLTWLVFKQHAKLFLLLNLRYIVFGAIAYSLLFKLLPFLLDNPVTQDWDPIETIADSSGRFELWRYAWQYIKENPWLGIGPMHYAYYPRPTHAHPHNSLLQWASEMGILSALLMLYLVYAGLCAWVKKFYRLQAANNLPVSPHLWIGLFASLCAGLIYSLFSGVIVMPLSQMMMVLIIGWMLGIYYQDQPTKPVTLKQRIGLQLVAGVTLITLVYTALPDVLQRLNNEELPIQDYPIIAPRFWQIGGIPHR